MIILDENMNDNKESLPTIVEEANEDDDTPIEQKKCGIPKQQGEGEGFHL